LQQSLKDKFDETCLRLTQGRRFEGTGSDPIYYLVFPVRDILTVKRQTRAWVAKLENMGWHVVTFSIGKAVNSILRGHKLRKQWLIGEKDIIAESEHKGTALEFDEINKTLAKALSEGTEVIDMIKAKIEEASLVVSQKGGYQYSTPHKISKNAGFENDDSLHNQLSVVSSSANLGGLLLLTDLEVLHPYLRINSIEAQLQGAIKCPIVVLYPGKREGKTSLRFLEFYPADPNYRSEHIG